jgi:hypothetical protein
MASWIARRRASDSIGEGLAPRAGERSTATARENSAREMIIAQHQPDQRRAVWTTAAPLIERYYFSSPWIPIGAYPPCPTLVKHKKFQRKVQKF